MNYNIYEQLNLLRIRKEEIRELNEKIDDIKKKADMQISAMTSIVLEKKKELTEISDTILSIRLGDLISEISFLSGISISDIHVLMETNIDYDGDITSSNIFNILEECVKSNGKKVIRFTLWSESDNNDFCYFTFLPLDSFLAKDAKGNSLYQHISFRERETTDGRKYNSVVINKDIEDFMCNFSIGYINYHNGASWYPADLMSEAIVNCVLRQHDKSEEKTRVRIKNQ